MYLLTAAILLTLLALFPSGCVARYPLPNSCVGACSTHDPAIIRRSDGTYFHLSTNLGLSTSSSPSLSGPWTYLGSALPLPPLLPYGSDYWAPSLTYHNSTYYLHYSVSSFGSQSSGIGVATSPNLLPGSWTDHGSIGLDSSPGMFYNAIDANLVEGDNGSWHVTLGSYWADIFQAPMRRDLLKAAGPAEKWLAFDPEPPQAVEGAFVFKENRYWFLFYSAGQCCGLDTNPPSPGKEYRIKACRSGRVDGGYVDRSGRSCLEGGGEVVLESHGNVYAPGGQGVLRDPGVGIVMYYHYKNRDVGIADKDTVLGWNLLDFGSGWPVVIPGPSTDA